MKVRYHILNALFWVSIIGIMFFTVLFVAFYYHGERVIKYYLTNKVYQTSKGLYSIHFDDFSYHLITGKVVMTNFQLIPNEALYEKLRLEGKVKSTLYAFSYKKLILRNISLKEIYLKRAIHLSEIELDNPHIRLVAFPDTTVIKQDRFKQVYKDIYPVMSSLFKKVQIDSILVHNGVFYGTKTLQSGKVNAGDWRYSAVLRDFLMEVDKEVDPNRIFYSRDVELQINDFQYALSDSLYFLHADVVGFTLKGSRLFGKGISLSPNFSSRSLATSAAGHFYQVYLPDFFIEGVDLLQALRDRVVQVHSFTLDNLSVNVFKNEPARAEKSAIPREVHLANLYTIIEKKLTCISIDTFLINNAAFRFFPTISTARPELRVDRCTLQVGGFKLDSLAYLDTTKIFYSDNIALNLHGLTLALEDKLHELTAEEISISTANDQIYIQNAYVFPSTNLDIAYDYKSNSYYRMFFAEIRLLDINIRRMFNTRQLEFSQLSFQEPDISIIQYREKMLGQDTNERGELFLHKLDLALDLVTPYMVSVNAREVNLINASVVFRVEKMGITGKRISGLVDLTLTGFKMDKTTLQQRKLFLNQLEIDLSLRDFSYVSLDSLHRVSLDELYLNTKAKMLNAKSFRVFTTSKQSMDVRAPSTLEVNVKTLEINGFDKEKWINHQWLQGGDIHVIEPTIQIRSFLKKKQNTLSESFAGFEEKVGGIEIGSIRIDRGTFDMVEEDQEKRRGVFLKGFNFALTSFLLDATGWNKGEKVFRYDSLSLDPDPAYPLILDSLFSISFSRFFSASYPPSFSVKELQIKQLARPSKEPSTTTISLKIPSFFISKLNLEKALFDRSLIIDTIRVTDPEIFLLQQLDTVARVKNNQVSRSVHPLFSSPFDAIEFNACEFQNGSVRYTTQRGDTSSTITLQEINATLSGFRYDTNALRKNLPSVFYCRDINVVTGPYSMVSNDSLYTLSVKGLRISTQQSKLVIDSFQLIPNYSDYDFSRKMGFQTDRMELKTQSVVLERLNYTTLFEKHRLYSGLLTVNGLVMNDYRDKRVEFPTWKRPPMIQQALRKIPFPLTIDTLVISNGQVTYREQNGDEPGMLFVDRMDILAQHFSNDSALVSRGEALLANASCFIMGRVKIEGEFSFPLDSQTDTFSFRGKAGQASLTLFNPMISNITPVRIRSGIVDSLDICWIHGNHSVSTGILDLYYHGLQVDLLDTKKGFMNNLSNEIMTMLVNLAVPQENPGYFGIHRRGYIGYNRNVEKGYFNFFWKSILSGLLSSEGINTKEQRVLKRKMKQLGK